MELYFAKGASGGRSSGGARSTPKSSTSKPKAAPKSSSPAPAKPAPKAADTKKSAPVAKKAKPSAKPTAAAKVTTATKPKAVTSATSKNYSNTGYRVGEGYQPRFREGYSAPAGSVVYYPQHSALDYLPWIYLFSQSSPSHDQAAIVQPNGQQVMAEPQKGMDGMAIFNWFLIIVFAVAIIGGIMWLVNKKTQPKANLAYA